MTRLFDQHQIRPCISLDGEWDYAFPAAGQTAISPADWDRACHAALPVPGVWEMLPERADYRGQALARRRFSAPRSGPARLVFKGVSHTATVYLDGQEVGRHHNAFTPFTIDIPALDEGEHELLLHISNEHGDISALHVPNDYYTYGGISRPVEIQFPAATTFIRHIHAVPRCVDGVWQADVTAVIRNIAETTDTTYLRLELAGETALAAGVRCEPGDTPVDLTIRPDNAPIAPWSPDSPTLYTLTAQLLQAGKPTDDLSERIGFRTVEVRGSEILLNGEPIYPIGFNRHEDHPAYGCAIPVDAMRQDLRLFRDMHANAVRTCHYPNDERFLDLCDELGFLVWEENHARGLFIDAMRHPRFRQQCADCNEEMVREHFNHPSIFVWGLLNECESGTDEGAAMYQEQIDQLRALDSSRPITFASCRHNGDLCQGMIDIAGWNIYPLWYSPLSPAATVDRTIERMDPVGMAGKPLIISEFGAGAIPGYHDPVRRAKWSEERQADIIDQQLAELIDHPRPVGLFIWQFCDVRVDEEWAMKRPRTMNNKGVVDEYRRPKLAYSVVKEHFAALTERQG